MTGIFSIPSKPSCFQLEKLNIALERVPVDDPIVLSLARNTRSNFFAETSIAQLISHLAQRPGRLVIRDAHNSWLPVPNNRFVSRIDGVAALAYSHLIASGRLENAKQQPAPDSLYGKLETLLWNSGCLEDHGPTRTFVAIDPEHPNPVKLSSPQGFKTPFEMIALSILREFHKTEKSRSSERQRAEEQLFNFVYEIFQNTIEHGRYSKKGQMIAGVRYLRLHNYKDTSIEKLSHRAAGFEELKAFITRRGQKDGTKRFIELAVADAGQGITSHYLNSQSFNAPQLSDRAQVIQGLFGGTLSSKRAMSGVGFGLPNAMAALEELEAFVNLRTEEFWLYRDYSAQNLNSDISQPLLPVRGLDQLSPIRGTQFNVLIDFPI